MSASDHYTLLRTLESIFHLPHLGYSAKRQPFGQSVFPSESEGNGGATTT